MTRISVVALFFIGLTFYITVLKAQPYDNVGSGRALQFDGIDDHVNLGNRFDDLSLPVTISVWVNVSSDLTYAFPIFNSQDNLPLYNGVTFAVSPFAFSIQYGDGMGENNPAFRRGKSASIPDIAGRWVNLTAIMRGPTDMDLFLNGINIGGEYGGSSNLPMASMFPADDAKIGSWFSNGITTHYKGLMDELRIYNRSLSQSEIREQMCKRLSGNEPGLIGYWTFDEISGNLLKDKSPNHFDGQLMGNPVRVFSGAPIGDKSLNLYTTSWTDKSLKLDDLEVINIQGNPQGIHIYKVADAPSQTNGLDLNNSNSPYYGVFTASTDVGNSFDLKETSMDLSCKAYNRNDNSIDLWTELNSYTSLFERKEIIPTSGDLQEIDLGPDQILCDQPNYVLESNIDLTGKSIIWNTGQTSSSISISESGIYALEVSYLCKVDRDTVSITFLETPPPFSLGNDEQLCDSPAKILKPYTEAVDFQFEWQDGSIAESFEARETGTYWVSVKNACGLIRDTVNLIYIKRPSPFSLGEDEETCDLIPRTLTPYTDSEGLDFQWQDGSSDDSFEVQQFGIYWVTVTNACGVSRDTINIRKQKLPPSFSFGVDEEVCILNTRILKPYADTEGFNFEWQNGSKNDSFEVKDFGKYWVTIKNACGSVSDTLEISKRNIMLNDLPNIITPNDDSFNQYFIVTQEMTGPHRLLVYNRWGEIVFKSTDYKNDWDASGLSTGVYYYILRGECINETKGSLTISR
jgi:hypothetical protein